MHSCTECGEEYPSGYNLDAAGVCRTCRPAKSGDDGTAGERTSGGSPELTLRSLGLAQLALSAVFMFLVWASSPLIFGVREPWDTGYPFYSVASVTGGIVIGLVFRKKIASCFLGAWVGQVLALVLLPGGDITWLLLGFVTTALGSLFLVLGVFIGSSILKK